MDTLTHALSGALLARATAPKDAPPRSAPRRIAAGFLACAAPDLDFVFSFLGPVEYLLLHRGPTHSVLLAPLWALGISWLLAKLLREPGGWKVFYGVTVMALYAHIAGDLITSFGTIVFSPLSDWRAAIGTTFIIDLWFSGIILAGLVACAVFRRSKVPAFAASCVLAGYVAFQYVQKHQALAFGEAHARALGLKDARVVAHPRPVSPFNWTVFVSDAEAHRFAHVNLVRAAPRAYAPGDGFIAKIDAPYLPKEQAIWVTRSRYGETPEARVLAKQAWNAEALGFFRWFADLPALDGISEGSTCAWFADLRFLTPGREGMPFLYGACRDGAGPWRVYQRQGDTRILLR
ncbi:MAG TPA: metal-dependent hydrolase [Burkholderiales bacterium]|nr:metal-dependent hydrolase [Burkholderiales bacterium]